MIRIILYLIIY